MTTDSEKFYNRDMIIDFHTHCFPDSLAPRAMHNLQQGSPYPPRTDGTAGDLARSMKQAGIDVSVLQHIATNAKQTRHVNDFAIATNAQKEFVSFGSVHPDCAYIDEELQRLRAAGIKGIKLHPDFQNFYADDRAVYPLYEKIAAYGFILLFHCGYNLTPHPCKCPPDRFARVARDFAGAKIVGAHLGGQGMWDEVFAHVCGKDVYLDTSYGFGWLTNEQLHRFCSEHNPDKILFGTDSPWADQKSDVDMMRRRITDPVLRKKIMEENAATLLQLTEN